MNYEQKYKEALAWVESIYPELNHEHQMEAETFFSELAKSEDEKIREEIIQSIKDNMVVIHKDKCLAWLEKLKVFSEHGDGLYYFGNNGFTYVCNPIWDNVSWLEKQDKSSDQIHYWTEEEIEHIISDYLRGAEHYGGMIARLRCLKPKSLEKQGEKTKPIEGFDTEFERQISHLIASAIDREHEYNEGYVKWTANALLEYAKRELEKQGEQILANSAKTCKDEQKPAWSEEDEARLQSCLNILQVQAKGFMGITETINTKWLKSLKNRVQSKPQWKPSDEQLYILNWLATNVLGDGVVDKKASEILYTLYDDLKKL